MAFVNIDVSGPVGDNKTISSSDTRGRGRRVEWVVVGDGGDPGCKPGDIREVLFAKNIESPLLLVTYDTTEGGKVRNRITAISIHPHYGRKGWATMRDLYAQDPEKSKHWEDWVSFKEAQTANQLGMQGVEFPDEMLPKRVLELRAIAEKTEQEKTSWQPPTRVREAQEAAEREELAAIKVELAPELAEQGEPGKPEKNSARTPRRAKP